MRQPKKTRARKPRTEIVTNDAGVLPDTDLANCRRLVAAYGADFRYTPERGWLAWDSGRWHPDAEALVMQKAKAVATKIFNDISAAPNAGSQDAMLRWARKSQSRERLSAMVALAQTEPEILVSWRDFDADPWLLNCANGIVDLRSGELLPHERARLCARQVPIAFDMQADCPTWHRFLADVLPSAELRAFVRRAVGYSLSGSVREQILLFLYGTGRNGKSAFLETIRHLLGDYTVAASMETFIERHGGGGIPNDIARLAGARMVSVSETSAGQRLNEALVKDLTGGDTVTARFLHREYFDFRAIFKLWIRGNHRPVIRGSDLGIWRRIHLVPFTITVQNPDPDLPDALLRELPGILTWAVTGALDWQLQGLAPPADVRAAVEDYRADMDVLGPFIENRCIVAPDAGATAADLYGAYTTWARSTGQDVMSIRSFGEAMTERGFERRRTGTARTYRRIGLRAMGQ